jgi:hypothetical protein
MVFYAEALADEGFKMNALALGLRAQTPARRLFPGSSINRKPQTQARVSEHRNADGCTILFRSRHCGS